MICLFCLQTDLVAIDVFCRHMEMLYFAAEDLAADLQSGDLEDPQFLTSRSEIVEQLRVLNDELQVTPHSVIDRA